MREIKFRAWLTLSDYDEDGNDRDYHAMVDGVSVSSGGYVGFSLDQGSHAFGGDIFERAVENGNAYEYEEWCTWEGQFNLMQYTGLKDKNGVEIYEGDIVRPLEHSNYVVKWYNEESGGVSTYGYYMEVTGMPDVVASINPIQAKKLEVIGNIYENPELLTNKGGK